MRWKLLNIIVSSTILLSCQNNNTTKKESLGEKHEGEKTLQEKINTACYDIVTKEMWACFAYQLPMGDCPLYAFSYSVFGKYPDWFQRSGWLVTKCISICSHREDVKPALVEVYSECINGKIFSDWFIRNIDEVLYIYSYKENKKSGE